jgi:hypothetical protein
MADAEELEKKSEDYKEAAEKAREAEELSE